MSTTDWGTVYVPPWPQYVPPRPGQAVTPPLKRPEDYTEAEFNLGWNASAFSVASLTGNLVARFNVRAGSIGVVVGLAAVPEGDGFSNMSHSLAFDRGAIGVRELGVLVADDLGTNAAGDVYEIIRMGNDVVYYRNGAVLYRSKVPSDGKVWMDAALFAAGDGVLSPAFEPYTGAYMNTMIHPIGEVQSFSGLAQLVLRPLDLAQPQGATLTMAPLAVWGANQLSGSMASSMAGLSLQAHNEAWTPAYAICSSYLYPMIGVGRGLTGTIGGGDVALQELSLLAADHPYAEGRGRMRPMEAFSWAAPEADLVYMIERPFLLGDFRATRSVVLAMNETLTAGALITVEALAGVSTIEDLSIETLASLSGEFAAALVEAVWVSDPATASNGVDDSETWAVNAETGASSRYESYGFNSYAVIDGVAYGAKSSGIFKLEGDDDAGEPIQAHLHFGQHDFGMPEIKSVPNVYVGVGASGAVYLRAGDGKDAYLYRVRHTDTRQATQRFDLGKGLRASYFTFELYNEGGADFELDTIRFEVVPLKRRI
ncbi:hypothetical protein [Acidovorax sp. NB1]|uniref:hypothetical protein n=1 Tax=Acidovorax sp. NB1 TaxID=1943571 RepID=UPI0010EAFFFE|nr:hypothetical protein [Acidovorax sp. NB1]GDY37217.1 hypothetical protein ACINB_31090 [Acidovorax sp. NB1]